MERRGIEGDVEALADRWRARGYSDLLIASHLRDAMERLEGRSGRLTTADLISIGRLQQEARRKRPPGLVVVTGGR